METQKHTPKVSIIALTSTLLAGPIYNSDLYAKLTVAKTVTIPSPTIYSPKISGSIYIHLHKKHCQKAIAEKNKFRGQNVLTLAIDAGQREGTENEIYTLISGIAPKKGIKKGEIDAVKLLGCDDIKINLTKLKLTKKPFKITFPRSINTPLSWKKNSMERFDGISKLCI
jgi:hypothetical protein